VFSAPLREIFLTAEDAETIYHNNIPVASHIFGGIAFYPCLSSPNEIRLIRLIRLIGDSDKEGRHPAPL
jgi:hypothetical protein